MIKWKSHGMRNWVLSAAATGLLCQSLPVFGQSRNLNFFSKKSSASKPVPAPAPSAEPPRLLAVPDSPTDDSSSAQPILQTAAGEKSEVQKQLEALYEKDGRTMPPMITSVQPINPTPSQPQQGAANSTQAGTTAPQQPAANPAARGTPATTSAPQNAVRPGQGYTQYTPHPQAIPYTIKPINQSPQATSGTRNYAAVFDAQSTSQQPVEQVAVQPQPVAPAPLPPQQQQAQSPSAPPQKNPNLMARFFKKIGVGTRQQTQPPLPPDYNPAVPNVPPVSGSGVAGMPPAQVPMTPPALASTPQGIPQLNPQIGSLPELPPPLVSIPALAQQATPISVATTAESTPPLKSEPQPQAAAAAPETLADKSAPVVASPITDFPNPFTEITEAEADKKIAPKSAVAMEVKDTSPPTQAAPMAAPEVAQKPEEDPFANTAKDFSEPMLDESVGPGVVVKNATPPTTPKAAPTTEPLSPPALTAPSGDDAKPAVESTPGALTPSFDTGGLVPPETTVDPHLEKMKRIRDRFGMKGLKGFCPVTLHDERDLVDARPEFHFTHRTQKFHFASAEAREKFAADPSRYAPAAYGADVVALSRDKDVVEGTLDYAAWFKGRLYLFGSQENYNAFVASPAKFATLTGIE